MIPGVPLRDELVKVPLHFAFGSDHQVLDDLFLAVQLIQRGQFIRLGIENSIGGGLGFFHDLILSLRIDNS